MNRGGLQETMMLHCLNKSGGVSISNIAELTVLERQRSGTKWQMQQGLVQGGDQLQGQMCKDSNHQPASIPLVKPESVLEKTCAGLSNYGMASVEDFESCGYPEDSVIDYNYQKMKSYPAVSIVDESSGGKDSVLTATEGGKKRKADRALKVASGSNTTEMKKIKEWAGDEESKVTQHRRSTNHKVKNKNKAGDAFIDASTVSQVQRTDYIHVRARRGEATDSHSLAERVRRERISERMKYLQELVPGCNKITGKAGMLDEIINYVQSLQRQVEFLSMKLATVNPQLNYSIDSLFAKEVVTPCTSSYPTLGELSEMANPAYLQFNLLEEVVSSGMDVGNYQPEMGVQQQLPEEHIDTTAFHQTPSPWEAELHNLLAMEFQGGSMSFPSQPVTGSTDAHNRKMEI